MPELGEVEIVRRNLEKWWVNQSAKQFVILDREVFSSGEDRFETTMAQVAVKAGRRGKYLFVTFANNSVIVFHFRMTGKITLESTPDARFMRIAWKVNDGWLSFKDARRLGHIDVFSAEEFQNYRPIAKMGPEPFDITGAQLKDRVGKRNLKSALLDQSVIAGVGNIAVSEVFWRLQLAPDILAIQLTEAQWDELASGLSDFFSEVIEFDAADEIEYVNQGGPNTFDVYGRLGEACPRCGAIIARQKIAGRSSYSCAACQPAAA
jgi:formamidopyrimidine-DNA glycosylase